MSMDQIIAMRDFNLSYIILDSIFLCVFIALLIIKKKYLTLFWALFGGILYFAVDYGIFHLATHSRSIEGGEMFWVLLWMSLSYGITNFAWIWLALKKDKHLIEWTLLIFIWWIACPLISKMIPSPSIHIERTTNQYRGVMGVILFISYLSVIIYNLLLAKDKKTKVNIISLFIIGFLAQFGWEFSLLLGGIRSGTLTLEEKIITLLSNSLIETNLGLPAMLLIYLAITSKVNEDLNKNKQTIKERLITLNETNYFKRNEINHGEI